MTNFAKVKGHNDLVRELHSKAILSIDKESLMEHRKKKKVLSEIFANTERINRMESDIEEIKQMVLQLITNSGVK